MLSAPHRSIPNFATAQRLFALCLGIALIWPAAPAAAQTFRIEVGGVTYELTATLGSYADYEAAVGAATAQSQPWYDGSVPIASADNTLATAWGDAFQTAYAVDSQGFDPAVWYAFAFTTDGTNARADFYRPLGDVRHNEDTFGVGSDVFAVTTDFGGGFPWSFVSAEVVPAVPEIDGNALAKALFILFALGLWMRSRRDRLAEAGQPPRRARGRGRVANFGNRLTWCGYRHKA